MELVRDVTFNYYWWCEAFLKAINNSFLTVAISRRIKLCIDLGIFTWNIPLVFSIHNLCQGFHDPDHIVDVKGKSSRMKIDFKSKHFSHSCQLSLLCIWAINVYPGSYLQRTNLRRTSTIFSRVFLSLTSILERSSSNDFLTIFLLAIVGWP